MSEKEIVEYVRHILESKIKGKLTLNFPGNGEVQPKWEAIDPHEICKLKLPTK